MQKPMQSGMDRAVGVVKLVWCLSNKHGALCSIPALQWEWTSCGHAYDSRTPQTQKQVAGCMMLLPRH